MEKADVARGGMPKMSPFDIIERARRIGGVESSGGIGELDELAIGVGRISVFEKESVLRLSIEKMVADGNQNLVGELPNFFNAFPNEAKIVSAVIDDRS